MVLLTSLLTSYNPPSVYRAVTAWDGHETQLKHLSGTPLKGIQVCAQRTDGGIRHLAVVPGMERIPGPEILDDCQQSDRSGYTLESW